MAFLSGITTRMGKTDDGNTISDYDKEEQKRHFSIGTSVIPIEWDDCKVNVLDTPGYFDFVGEVEEAVAAADAAHAVVTLFRSHLVHTHIRLTRQNYKNLQC